jgi:hypothetical protein
VDAGHHDAPACARVTRANHRDRRRGGVWRDAAAEKHPLVDGLGVLALALHHVHPPVRIEIGEREAERAWRRRAVENIEADLQPPLPIVHQQSIGSTERPHHEVGITVGINVEKRRHVVVFTDVGGLGPPRLRRITKAALAVVAKHVLAPARRILRNYLPVVQRDEVEKAIAVEIHRLVFVVVGVLRQCPRIVGELARAVVTEQRTARAALARHQHVEVGIVVDIGQLEVP